MTEVQAAVGRVQLRRLDQWHSERARNAQRLRRLLDNCSGLIVPECPEGIEHAWYRLYAFVAAEQLRAGWTRDRVIAEIQAAGENVGCGSCGEIYREKAFAREKTQLSHRVAQRSHHTSLAFLVHPGISDEKLEKLATTVRAVMGQATMRHATHLKKAG